MQLFLAFLICLSANTIGAISGIGGGILIKPIFDAIGGLSTQTISFLSGCAVLAMSTASLASARRHHAVLDIRHTIYLAIGASLGGVLGKSLFHLLLGNVLSGRTTRIIQNSVVMLLTLLCCFYMKYRQSIRTRYVENAILCIGIGLTLGIISTFLGIGGGIFNLIVLYYFFSMDTKKAARNSLFIIFFSQSTSLFSTMIEGQVPDFSPLMLFYMVLGGILGGICGHKIASRLTDRQMDRLFQWVLAFILLISLFNILKK